MKNILIVENDINSTEINDFLNETSGYVFRKVSYEISVGEIITTNPNLIILDYLTTDGLSSELCLELKNNQQTKHIPVILISARKDLKQIAKDSCADAYILKPFDIPELENKVKKMAL